MRTSAVRLHAGPSAQSVQAARLAQAFAYTLDALLAWQQGDFDAALQALDAAQLDVPFHIRMHSPLCEQHLNRYLRAEILFTQERYREALPWYSALYDGYYHWSPLYPGPSYLRRAQIYEPLGREAEAEGFYQRFIKLWQDSDPAAHPMLEQAQAALYRLSM